MMSPPSSVRRSLRCWRSPSTGSPLSPSGTSDQRGSETERPGLAFETVTPVEIWDGSDLQARVHALGDRPVVVADAHLLESGLLDDLIATIRPVAVLEVPAGEPKVSSVQPIADELADTGNVVVGIGGGSSLDTAKLAAGVARSPSPLTDHLMAARPIERALPVVAVPTTAGSGAEVTRTAVVSVGSRKSWAWDNALRPRAAVLIPELTHSLPPGTTIASGLDAFVHSLESATAQIRHEESERAGVWAAGEIHRALPQVVAAPDDRAARAAMQRAACAAGIGIDRCGTGIGHALGHALGSVVAVPHGLAVMLGALVALEWGVTTQPDRFETVAASIVPEAKPADMPRLVRELADAVGFEAQLGKHASNERLTSSELATEVARREHEPMCVNNVVPPEAEDLGRLAADVVAVWNRSGGHV